MCSSSKAFNLQGKGPPECRVLFSSFLEKQDDYVERWRYVRVLYYLRCIKTIINTLGNNMRGGKRADGFWRGKWQSG